MAKRKIDADPFATNDAPELPVDELAGLVYGDIRKIDDQKIVARPLSIHEILPDSAQPRKPIPWAVQQRLSSQDITEAFSVWIDLIREERGFDFELHLYLGASEDIEHPDNIGPLETTFISLIELANSIRNEGLTNPITVCPEGMRYQIETGERRWLAHHLLAIAYPNEPQWTQIPARVVNNHSIWRQASENNARSNLNAISRARQFAVLLMDLLSTEQGMEFIPYSSFDVEQDYYAQVKSGDGEYGIPRNTSERLLNAIGLKHRKQLQQHRALLRLPNVVWRMGDDLNWTEYFMRNLMNQAKDENDLIALASQHALKSGYSGTVVPLSRNRTASSSSKKPARSRIDLSITKAEKALTIRNWQKTPVYERLEIYERLKVLLEKMERWGFDD